MNTTEEQPEERPEFIVAEVSKGYINGVPIDEKTGPICVEFEKVINTNRKRGYRLHSWKLDRILDSDSHQLNETIIAVFESIEWQSTNLG